jgi:DNA recombination protein RmuC
MKLSPFVQIESPDFVLYYPIEPAFAMALNEDTSLYNKAFEKNIVIVTPATLLATLRRLTACGLTKAKRKHEIARPVLCMINWVLWQI